MTLNSQYRYLSLFAICAEKMIIGGIPSISFHDYRRNTLNWPS